MFCENSSSTFNIKYVDLKLFYNLKYFLFNKNRVGEVMNSDSQMSKNCILLILSYVLDYKMICVSLNLISVLSVPRILSPPTMTSSKLRNFAYIFHFWQS